MPETLETELIESTVFQGSVIANEPQIREDESLASIPTGPTTFERLAGLVKAAYASRTSIELESGTVSHSERASMREALEAELMESAVFQGSVTANEPQIREDESLASIPTEPTTFERLTGCCLRKRHESGISRRFRPVPPRPPGR